VVDGRSSVVMLLQCFIKAREFAVEASGAFTTRSFTVHREDSKILRRKASGVNNRVGKDCKKENIRGTVISRRGMWGRLCGECAEDITEARVLIRSRLRLFELCLSN
jgi:hypothetical protein